MRFANVEGRSTLITAGGRGVDLEKASEGALPAAPGQALERWDEVLDFAASANGASGEVEIDPSRLGPPSPAARQIFAVGFNYDSHIAETKAARPDYPTIFAKLFTSLAGPQEQVPISTAAVDWEVELALVIGKRARRVAAKDAWDHIAGLTVAQDLSEREIQLRPKDSPQYVLGKSLPRFCPTGPLLVSADELDDPEDLEISCTVNGEEVQHGRTSEFIYSIPELLEYLSGATELLPGDLILTGTPSGIGATREPPRFLSPGDVLVSEIGGIGQIRQEFVDDEQ